MKVKYLIMVSLILAIVTIGAVSSADVSADGNMTASDEIDVVANDDWDDDLDPDDDDSGDDEGDDDLDPDDDWDLDGDAEDGVVLWGDEYTGFDVKEDLDEPFIAVSINETFQGNLTITKGRDVFFNKNLNAIDYKPDENIDGFRYYAISLKDLKNRNNFLDTEDSIFEIVFTDSTGKKIDNGIYEMEVDDGVFSYWTWDDWGDDSDDGVIINVAEEEPFNLQTDLKSVFCSVSVEDYFDGYIVIYGLVYDNEDDATETVLFNKTLAKITNNEPDEDFEGFTIYNIKFNDLSNPNKLKTQDAILVAFFDAEDDSEPYDYDEYSVEYDSEANEVTFYLAGGEDDGDDDFDDDEEIEVQFFDANAVTDDVVICIIRDGFPPVDDTFKVFLGEEDEDGIEFNLSELEEDEDGWLIRVSDLISGDEFDEFDSIFMHIEFYEFGEYAYSAVPEDDESGIYIYKSPYINTEAYILDDDAVVTITGFTDEDMIFNATVVSDYGVIVKTFRLGDLKHSEYDDDTYEIRLSDFGISKEGNYLVAVNFTFEDNDYFVDNDVEVKMVDIWSYEIDDEGKGLKTFDSVDQLVYVIKVNEDFKGYVVIKVNGSQSSDSISLADLPYGTVQPDDGRQIKLNHLNITETGYYNVVLELYNQTDGFLTECPIEVMYVEVNGDHVEFSDGGYGCEPCDVIEFSITTPLKGQYYNIYLNGELAGNFTADYGVVISDEFTDQIFDANLMKSGDYNVNVTFFDGEKETDFANGTISIKSLDLTTDKEVYNYGIDSTLISFKLPGTVENAILSIYFVENWGPQGIDVNGQFVYFGDEISEFIKDGVVTIDVAWDLEDQDNPFYMLEEGTNYIHVTYRYENRTVYGGFISFEVVEPTVDPKLSVSVSNINEGSAAIVKVTTDKSFSGTVIVQIGDEPYEVEVINGSGTLRVPGLSASNYDVKATIAGYGSFSYSEASAQFVVNKKSNSIPNSVPISTYTSPSAPVQAPAPVKVVKLTLKKVKTVKKSAKKLVLKATLTINGKAQKGLKVTFKFNKKTFTARTNAKGVAKVTVKAKVLKKLKAGKKVKIQASYGKTVKKMTVKVKK